MTEENSNQSYFVKWFEVWKAVVANPVQFFANMPKSGGLKEPLIFALVLLCILSLLTVVSGIFFGQFNQVGPMGAFVPVFVIVFGIFWLFVMSGILHLFVMMVGGKNGFEATFRVMAYVKAIDVFTAIPYGSFVVGIWAIALLYIGIKAAHELDMPKALIAVLSPFIIIMVVAATAAFYFRGSTGGGMCPLTPSSSSSPQRSLK